MVKNDDFFKETTLRICGNLDIAKALADVYDYFRFHFPIIGVSLNITDDDLGAVRRIALAADNQKEFPKEITPFPKDLWNELQSLALYDPFIFTADMDEPFSSFAALGKLEDKAELVLPLWTDDKLIGALGLRATKQELLTRHHMELLSSIRPPMTIALINALAHEKIKRTSELLAEDNRLLREEFIWTATEGIIGHDGGLNNLMQMVKQVAPLNNTVLILGETGTGKEVIANAIHFSSSYKNGPFIKVNCGAIPEHLIDSELFGHEKGAFTGAVTEHRGRFERANTGSIFLDEIGELPAQAQIRLLRVLQNREIERVGGHKSLPLNIRVIAATNRNLEGMVIESKFREDLWYRLNVFPLIIPPLRQRKEDIPALTIHFISKKSREMGIKNLPSVAPGALERLRDYDWPGNVRELENLVERELIVHRDGILTFESLPGNVQHGANEILDYSINNDIWPIDDVVATHIKRALRVTKGKISGPGGAAELLRINPNTLHARMKKFDIYYQGAKHRK
jgi:transcriptional regulator with GAF, ATPase, and Fis domain